MNLRRTEILCSSSTLTEHTSKVTLRFHVLAEYPRLDRSKFRNGANNQCHPNSIALVGNLLTGKGNVVEVVKVRWAGRIWCTETFD